MADDYITDQFKSVHKSFYSRLTPEQKLKRKERNKKHVIKWRLKNKEKVTQYHANREARKKGAKGTCTPEDVKRIYIMQKGKCANCKIKLNSNFHRDHILPLCLGGKNEPKNIQLMCEYCNCAKGGKHPLDYAKYVGKLV